MGKRGSLLISFLMDALVLKKYLNLKFENKAEYIFSLTLPRKTKKLNPQYEQILKDWRALKKQPYDYTKAKQAIESALKKTVFLEKMKPQGESLMYRKLNNEEVLRKKMVLKGLSAVKKEYPNPASVSSGYGSGRESPLNISSQDMKDNMHVIPDHDYFSLIEVADSAPSLNVESIKPVSPLCVTEIKDEANETNYFMEHDDIFHEYLCLNPNTIPIDPLKTQFSDFDCQIFQNSSMCGKKQQIWDPKKCDVTQIGTLQQISEPIGKVNPLEDQSDSLTAGEFSDYLDLQNAFDDLPLENTSESAEVNELMKSIENSFYSLYDVNIPIPKNKDAFYHFKESKSVEDGEIWIFKPQVNDSSVNENNPSSPRMILDSEKFRKMKTFSIEVHSNNDEIIVILKHLEEV